MATIADSVIEKLASSVLSLAREQREAAEDMRDIFSEKRPFLFMDKESDLRKRKIMREREYEKSKQSVQAAGELAKALEILNDDYSKNAATIGESTDAVKQAVEQTLKFSDSMTTAQQNMLLQAKADLDAGRSLQANMLPLIDTTAETGRTFVEMNDKHKRVVEQADKFQRSLIDMRNTLQDVAKSFFSYKTAIGFAVAGFVKTFDDLEYSLKNQVPIMNTLTFNLAETAAMYGVSTRVMMEVQNQHTVAMLAASRGVGGLAGSAQFALEEFGRLRNTLTNVTGDFDDSLKLYGQLREQMSFAGAAFSPEEFNKAMEGPDGIIKQMQNLAATTGKSVEQIAEMNTAMMKDRDMRYTMLGLDKKQRQNRLSEIMQYQQLLVNKGMEADQAYEAAMSLEKMNATIKPKDRYKQAAKIAAIGGALGIAGSEKVLARSMKAPGQWTDQDKKDNADYATAMETKMGGLAGGNVSQQMVGGALGGAMEGDLYSTLVKAQSTAGLEQRAISEKTFNEISKQTNQLQGVQDEMLAVKKAAEWIAAWGNDSGVYLAAGVTTGLLTMGAQLWQANMYLKAIAASQGGAALPGGMGKLGKLAKGAGILGAVGMMGKDAYDIATTEGDAKKEDIGGVSGGAIGAIAGGIIGSVLPVVGTAAGVAAGGMLGNYAGEMAGKWFDARDRDMGYVKDDLTKQLKEMNDGKTPEILALLGAIESQEKITKEQAELFKKNIETLKESNKLTQENSDATKAATVKTQKDGFSNRPPGGR